MTSQSIAQLYDLTKKSAIVTGGAKGIGQAVAFRLAEAGASVMIADVDLQAAINTVEQIEAKGGKALAIQADAGKAADVEKTVQATVKVFGHLDILVNNAAIFPLSPALDIDEEKWDKVLNVNLKGPFMYSRAAALEMVKAGHGGKIINIASIDALRPRGNLAHYIAAKGGIITLTKALALEFAPYGILVNTVAPGAITTSGGDALMSSFGNKEEIVEMITAHIPLGRMGEPDDIARVVHFLASGAADYMTGSLILVDGGYLLY